MTARRAILAASIAAAVIALPHHLVAQRDTSARPGQAVGRADPRTGQTEKPPLHGQALDGHHRQAARRRPPARMIFAKGGNAVDAACAMLAAAARCGTRSAGAARPRR